jgi:hypothetical protein
MFSFVLFVLFVARPLFFSRSRLGIVASNSRNPTPDSRFWADYLVNVTPGPYVPESCLHGQQPVAATAARSTNDANIILNMVCSPDYRHLATPAPDESRSLANHSAANEKQVPRLLSIERHPPWPSNRQS